MAFDETVIVAGALAIIVFMLIAYIAYRFREGRIQLATVNVDVLIERTQESEKMLQAVKNTTCWNCGSIEKDVEGNLYEDDQIKFKCKKCGTLVTWNKGKYSWKMATSTESPMKKLEDTVNKEKG